MSFWFNFTFIAIFIILYFAIIILLNFHWISLKEKLELWGVKLEYQRELIGALLIMFLLFLILLLPFIIILHNFLGWFGFWISISFPLVFMTFRSKTFKKAINIVGSYDNYKFFMLLSVLSGGFLTIFAFSSLNSGSDLFNALILIVAGLLSQTFPLFIDVFDRYLPIDFGIISNKVLTKKEYRIVMLILLLISFLGFGITIGIFNILKLNLW